MRKDCPTAGVRPARTDLQSSRKAQAAPRLQFLEKCRALGSMRRKRSRTPPAPFGFLHGYAFSLSRKSAAHSVIHRRSGSILSALSAL